GLVRAGCRGDAEGWGLPGADTACSKDELDWSPRNCSSSLPWMAPRMKSIQMGRAALAPVSLSPRDCRPSKPTQTPHVTEGEKPMNHASVKSLVVPVLPPSGCWSAATAAPVP